MRLDTRCDDIIICRKYVAFLNDRKIKECVMADEEHGIMLVQGSLDTFAEEEFVTRPRTNSPLLIDRQFVVKGKVELRKIER